MRIHAALHASLLEQCFRLAPFQHLAIRYHFSIYHQRRSCHHAVGGDLREIRHMVNGRVSPQFRESGADKLLLADWGFEVMGDELYGKVDVRLTEPMTEEEEKELRDWIRGQNSDGLGEGFEQREIPTDRGDLSVSFWDSGEGYFIKDDEEMDEYLGHFGQRFGGM